MLGLEASQEVRTYGLRGRRVTILWDHYGSFGFITVLGDARVTLYGHRCHLFYHGCHPFRHRCHPFSLFMGDARVTLYGHRCHLFHDPVKVGVTPASHLFDSQVAPIRQPLQPTLDGSLASAGLDRDGGDGWPACAGIVRGVRQCEKHELRRRVHLHRPDGGHQRDAHSDTPSRENAIRITRTKRHDSVAREAQSLGAGEVQRSYFASGRFNEVIHSALPKEAVPRRLILPRHVLQ